MHGYKWPINCTRTRTATRLADAPGPGAPLSRHITLCFHCQKSVSRSVFLKCTWYPDGPNHVALSQTARMAGELKEMKAMTGKIEAVSTARCLPRAKQFASSHSFTSVLTLQRKARMDFIEYLGKLQSCMIGCSPHPLQAAKAEMRTRDAQIAALKAQLAAAQHQLLQRQQNEPPPQPEQTRQQPPPLVAEGVPPPALASSNSAKPHSTVRSNNGVSSHSAGKIPQPIE